MKNVLITSITTLVILFSSGCKKKKESVATDPCANTVCLNGGTCIDGSCSCPVGYTGGDCGTQKTPTKITITAIKVTKFPALDGGSNWDGFPDPANPDIYARLTKVGSTTELLKTGRINDAPAGVSYDLPSVTPTDLTDLATQYNLELFDYDSISSNDTMGNINFSIYTDTNHFPTKITVDNGVITFEVTVSYTY